MPARSISRASHIVRTRSGSTGLVPKAAASRSVAETGGSGWPKSVSGDVVGLRHGGPVADLGGDVVAELRRRHRHRVQRFGGQLVAEIGLRQHAVDLLI